MAVQILSGAALVALIGGIVQEVTGGEKNGWIDGVAILVAVLLVTVVGVRNHSSSSSAVALFTMCDSYLTHH